SAAPSAPPPSSSKKSEAPAVAKSGKSDSRVSASPLAKRVAEQKGIDLSAIHGSGPNGRIVLADIEGARPAPSPYVQPAAPASAPSAPPQRTVSAPSVPRATPTQRVEARPVVSPPPSVSTPAAATAMPQGIDARDYADKLGLAYEAVPNSGVRKVIAKRLTESKQTVPHFYLTIDCEIDELLTLRKQLNEVAGTKISVNDCVIRAVALAMKKVPNANASWTNDAILRYQNIDISVAVATPNGLVTPIIKNVDMKTMAQISGEMKDLGMRAREGKLRPEEFQGGGFTISNLGMYGIREFSAIINPPQSCILAVGAGEQRPVVKNGQLAIATVMTCTLSVDHRSVDGAVGAEFLAAFKPMIEKPYSLVV
ncbi:MAG TPA: 2-oxo acid dehydrogenase subunit E2, partial [Alphaproteobacteria bacterium]|nr:2-oxo acid dehydrogenase subunit E2 [Alphaproteobacteria bacterium]